MYWKIMDKMKCQNDLKQKKKKQEGEKERRQKDKFGFILIMPSMPCSPTNKRGKTSENE